MKKTLLIFFITITSLASANKIKCAYQALSIYDYFKAKQLFYKTLKKYPGEASYGLATIYFREDNPFSNIDSAAKYIALSNVKLKDTITFFSYHLNKSAVDELAKAIAKKGFSKYVNQSFSVSNIYHYLTMYHFADDSLKTYCYLKRDGIQFDYFNDFKSSDSINQFMINYPESQLYSLAKTKFYEYEFKENVKHNNAYDLKRFIVLFPKNPFVKQAEDSLFALIKQIHSADSIYSFIKYYSTVLTQDEAWKTLYSISVKGYNKDELIKFINKYPDYPYNESVKKEISLSQKILIPFKMNNDLYGYVDTTGQFIIAAQYDDAFEFNEGFAAVCKNDSCFYINKEGERVAANYFDEVESYHDGVAIVKRKDLYYLINRSGLEITKGYQDISKSHEDLFVCKSNNLYGAINVKGNVVIPFVYDKLGNYKNGYAYYMQSGKYGLVDLKNNARPALWDWISDVDTNSIVIVKKENKFGLMTSNHQSILHPFYDYIGQCKNGIYLLVKNDLYGFYNAIEKCFITSVEYNYKSGLNEDYYTNGKQFKLLKDEGLAVVDLNGRVSINYGNYSNLFFAKNDIIRIEKNSKYGFVDKKLKAITPVEFDKASDFENNSAIVVKAINTQIIDRLGKVLYSIKSAEISRFEQSFYLVQQNKLFGLLDAKATTMLNVEFDAIEAVYDNLFRCQKSQDVFLFNSATKTLKKM